VYAGEEKGRIGNRHRERREGGRKGEGAWKKYGKRKDKGGKSDIKYRGWESAKEGDV
jgi:hypothetical protein